MSVVTSFVKGLVHPDTVTRTAKTFVAAAVPAFAFPQVANLYNFHAWESAVLAAAAAGITAVWNGLIKAFSAAVDQKAHQAAAPAAAPGPGLFTGPVKQP